MLPLPVFKLKFVARDENFSQRGGAVTRVRMWNEKRAGGKHFESMWTGLPPLTRYHSPITRILIASLPIRIRRNPNALNKNSISNRPKMGVFQPPVTNNLQPATYVSNRNCKELKIDATL